MKRFTKIISLFLAAIVVFGAFAGCSGKKTDEGTTLDAGDKSGAKILVVYFSYTGNLDKMSHWVADETGADLVRVLPKTAYPEDYNATVDLAKKEHDDGVRPEIVVDLTAEQMAQYDTVFFGFPVWWYDLPMCMQTFVESCDFNGKTVIPFFSHAGSSSGANSLSTLESLAKGAKVVSGSALSIHGDKVADSEDEVRSWVKGLGY